MIGLAIEGRESNPAARTCRLPKTSAPARARVSSGKEGPLMKSCAIFLCLVACLASCASKVNDPNPYATVSGFCEGWGKAACSATVVSHCAGVDTTDVTADLTSACVTSQQAFCEGLVPDGYVSTQAAVCVSAVKQAYSDGTLTSSEVNIVRHLGDPCNHLIKGTQVKGDTCTTDNDCDTVGNFLCVMKSGVGACEIPKVVGNGTSCSAPDAACNLNFYCDGAHCVQSLDIGEKCMNDFECLSGLACDATSGKCALRVSQTKCSSDDDCAAPKGVCDIPVGADTGSCVSAITLTPDAAMCETLK
jgi:hypothetical protein